MLERLGGRQALRALLDDFYGEVAKDPVIGPIFNSRIADWPRHIDRIEEFWKLQTGGASTYNGGMGKHVFLGLQPEHFDRWLSLWRSACRLHFPDALSDELVSVAEVFRGRLELMIARAKSG
jgi:hemoglobin